MYGHKVTHDGFSNTYFLHKDGRKITLLCLPPQQITKPKSNEPPNEGEVLCTLLEPTLKVEQREFKAFKEMILHAPPQVPPTKTPMHPLGKQILLEFAHVFPEDIPHGLPPQRTIQHHIDLIPGVILPNKHRK